MAASWSGGTVPRSFGGLAAWWTRPSRSRNTVIPHGAAAHSPPRSSTVTSGPARRDHRSAPHAATDTATSTSAAMAETNGRGCMAARRYGTPPGSRDATLIAMPVLRSRLDPNAPETRANHDAMAALVDDLRDAPGRRRRPRRRRRRPLDRAPPGARQAAGPRADRPPARPGIRLPRAEPARRDRPVRRRRAGRRDRHRHRPDRGHDLRRRRQRRHRQGRHLLPDDRQEAPPGPGDRPREPAAVRLPRRHRAARSCRSRPTSSRTATTSAGSSTTRPGCRPPGIPQVALVMGSCTAGGAYVPAMSDETVIVQGHRHDLPGRAAAREGGDRRGRHGRGAGRRPRSTPGARASPTTRRSTTSTRWRSAGRSSSNLNRKPPAPPWDRRDPEPPAVSPTATTPPRSTARSRSIRAGRSPSARSSPGSSTARASTSSSRSTARRWYRLRPPRGLPGRDHRQRRDPVQPVGAQGRPLHRARVPAPDPARLPPEHHRVHGRPRVRGGRHRQGRREAGHRGRLGRGAQVHGPHRRQLRGRQLRDGRPRVPAAVPVVVAEQPDQRHGRPAGGARPVDGPRRLAPTTPSATPSRRRSSRPTSARARRTSRRPASGTTASSTRSTRGASWRWASRPRSTRRSRRRGSASSGCELGRRARRPVASGHADRQPSQHRARAQPRAGAPRGDPPRGEGRPRGPAVLRHRRDEPPRSTS